MERNLKHKSQQKWSHPIDLRSDTVTKPGLQMRRVMAEARVGDDLYCEDPTVNKLEKNVAQLLSKEAALFVPTGTMGNLIALKAQSQPGEEVILEQQSHIYNCSLAGISAICGLLPRPIKGDLDGMLAWEEVLANVRPRVLSRSQTRMICLENTHNFAGGAVLDQAQVKDLCGRATNIGLKSHLDGARLVNASAATGLPLGVLASPFDSVMMSFSKGLGSPGGAILAGSNDMISRSRSIRKLLGGAIHQPGIFAAACLFGLKHMKAQLVKDHANAQRLAQHLTSVPGILVNPSRVMTNIVVLQLAKNISGVSLYDKLKQRGVLVNLREDGRIRLVTHCNVNSDDVDRAAEVIATCLKRRVRAVKTNHYKTIPPRAH